MTSTATSFSSSTGDDSGYRYSSFCCSLDFDLTPKNLASRLWKPGLLVDFVESGATTFYRDLFSSFGNLSFFFENSLDMRPSFLALFVISVDCCSFFSGDDNSKSDSFSVWICC